MEPAPSPCPRSVFSRLRSSIHSYLHSGCVEYFLGLTETQVALLIVGNRPHIGAVKTRGLVEAMAAARGASRSTEQAAATFLSSAVGAAISANSAASFRSIRIISAN